MAYNRYYQYETSPRKLQPEYEPIKKTYPKKSTARKTNKHEAINENKTIQIKIIFYVVICFTILFVISYRYSKIDDTYALLKSKQSKLSELEKETTQLEANIESNLNLKKIEEDAKNLLGMQQLKPEQTVYVTLPKTDHIESSSQEIESESSSENWLLNIINKIIANFK